MTNSPEWRDRIVIQSARLGGKPTVRGLRIGVDLILRALAGGETPESIVRQYEPHLEPADVTASLLYAAEVVATQRALPACDESLSESGAAPVKS
jgi:uncharacterized protein (DUF433 family)